MVNGSTEMKSNNMNLNHEVYAINGKSSVDVPLGGPTSSTAAPRKRRGIHSGHKSTHDTTLAQNNVLSRKADLSTGASPRFMGVGPGIGKNASDRPKMETVTATQRSVLLSKIAFFAFLAVVAAVAGGMFMCLS